MLALTMVERPVAEPIRIGRANSEVPPPLTLHDARERVYLFLSKTDFLSNSTFVFPPNAFPP
jgi:hypothetical protein